MNQLRSTSIVQVVKLRRAGFGARYSIDTFWERYHHLMASGPGDRVSKIKSYLKALDGTNQEWQVGKTKVFLKDFMARVLDQQRGMILDRFVVSIQRYIRRARAQRELIQLRQAREQQLARLRQEQLKREQEERMRREQEERARREQEERTRREQEERARRDQDDRMRREQEERVRREQEERRRHEEEERTRREQEDRLKPPEGSKFILLTTGPKKQPPSFSPHVPPRSMDNTMTGTSVSVPSPRSLDNTHSSLIDTSMSAPTFRNLPPVGGTSPRNLPLRPAHSPSMIQRQDSPSLSPQSSPRGPTVRPNRVSHCLKLTLSNR